MRIGRGYRYFLCIRPPASLLPCFREIGMALDVPVRPDRLHLTLCVVGEGIERDPFLTRRVQRALALAQLRSFCVNLSRTMAGADGAYMRSFGKQPEIQAFFRDLTCLLRASGVEPLYRKSGLHPHVTLAYGKCRVAKLKAAIQWFPDELLLIESELGLSRHNVLASWPLLPPRQPLLPFGEPIAATNPVRRSAA